MPYLFVSRSPSVYVFIAITNNNEFKGGGVLDDKADQQAVRTFLRHMQQTTSWNTEPMVASLQEQWDEF